tara:strand:+ start:553 stop:1053 length:501 start_codon:yes stop_codon:yes gene_type:complete
MNKHARLILKGNTYIKRDDDYETHSGILKDLLPFIKDYNVIYDPFYCKGTIIQEWKKLNKECINDDKDAFKREHPENYDLIFSNIPFSIKKKCFELFLSLNKPFIVLTTIDSLGGKWIKPYFDKFQFIIPNGRYNFIKNGILTKGSWLDTCFICYGLNLEKDIIKL